MHPTSVRNSRDKTCWYGTAAEPCVQSLSSVIVLQSFDIILVETIAVLNLYKHEVLDTDVLDSVYIPARDRDVFTWRQRQ